jgi:hypothetical protein
MGALFAVFLRGLLTFAAGLGAAKVLDKVAADKLPSGTAPAFPFGNSNGSINWMRVILFIFVGALAAVLLKFVGRKLNIKLLK